MPLAKPKPNRRPARAASRSARRHPAPAPPSARAPNSVARRLSPRAPFLPTAVSFLYEFALLAAFAYLALLPLQPLLALVAAHSSAFLLNLVGKMAVVVAGAPPLIRVFGLPWDASIVDLCTAALELALVFGFIFASRDRSMEQRTRGFALGVLVILGLNAARISTTLYLMTPSDVWLSTLAHDVFFRVFLVAALVGYYAVWYLGLTRAKR